MEDSAPSPVPYLRSMSSAELEFGDVLRVEEELQKQRHKDFPRPKNHIQPSDYKYKLGRIFAYFVFGDFFNTFDKSFTTIM